MAKKSSTESLSARQEAIESIIEQISDGTPLREICRQPGMPAWRTVYDWRDNDATFAARFAHARELGEEAIAQQCLTIADTPLLGEETEESENGKKVKRGDMLGHRKLQIETRLKLLAKWNPKKWGEKVAIGGADDLPPVRQLSEAELEGKIAELTAKLK